MGPAAAEGSQENLIQRASAGLDGKSAVGTMLEMEAGAGVRNVEMRKMSSIPASSYATVGVTSTTGTFEKSESESPGSSEILIPTTTPISQKIQNARLTKTPRRVAGSTNSHPHVKEPDDPSVPSDWHKDKIWDDSNPGGPGYRFATPEDFPVWAPDYIDPQAASSSTESGSSNELHHATSSTGSSVGLAEKNHIPFLGSPQSQSATTSLDGSLDA